VFFFQAEDGIRDDLVTGVQTCALPISVDPPMAEDRDWEKPEILVELSGPDSPLLLERGAELLRSLELLAMEMFRLPGNEHEKICFDCMNHRSMRLEELRMAASVAAERV